MKNAVETDQYIEMVRKASSCFPTTQRDKPVYIYCRGQLSKLPSIKKVQDGDKTNTIQCQFFDVTRKYFGHECPARIRALNINEDIAYTSHIDVPRALQVVVEELCRIRPVLTDVMQEEEFLNVFHPLEEIDALIRVRNREDEVPLADATTQFDILIDILV